uniref:Putative secreted protein n=1 Tax=Amblyomma americanum TaxID=6943 RepID=A0A0C9RW04_AMBAM
MGAKPILLVASILFAMHAARNSGAANDGENDNIVVWNTDSGDGCSTGCEPGCCLRGSSGNTCGPLADIGQYCSKEKATGEVYDENCPCKKKFRCLDKGDGISICAV